MPFRGTETICYYVVMNDAFIRGATTSDIDESVYPFSIPAIKAIESIQFSSSVTFFVGENGSGKSTLTEAIAVAAGFNAEGGTKNYNFATQDTTSSLADKITLVRGPRREKYGYFLRAESFYTTANYAENGTHDKDGPVPILFDGKHIHEQSHGEAFLSIVKKFSPGLFIFDEPESALSPQRQLALLVAIKELVERGSQFIIATHSPILLAYPNAKIYQLSQAGIDEVEYEDVEHVKLTKDFLNNREAYLDRLLNN
jgi:predicted ATPase